MSMRVIVRYASWIAVPVVCAALALVGEAYACEPTGFNGLTAAVVNPPTATGPIDATGCDIGVYFRGTSGTVELAEIWGARWFGVMVDGDAAVSRVDVRESWIHEIGAAGVGVAVYYRAFFADGGSAIGRIEGNIIERYLKGGIVANGVGTEVFISGNTVRGVGPVGFIVQNGIQIGYGANATVTKNTVEDNSYTGTSTAAGGIVVVGGAGYGLCPDGQSCPYTTGTHIVQNTVRDNDIGIFLTNLAEDDGAPATATSLTAANNVISNRMLQNNYGGFGYQAGISGVGNDDRMIANTIFGPGYDPSVNMSAYTVPVDADVSFTNRPKVHANR